MSERPKTSNEAIEKILELHKKRFSIPEIVRVLNKEGIRPAIAKRWNRNMVAIVLRRNGVPPTREEVGFALASTKTISIASKSSCDEFRLTALKLLDLPIAAEKKVDLVRALYNAQT